MEQIWQDTMLRALFGLLLANVLARIAAGLTARTVRVKKLVEYAQTEVLPWLVRGLMVEIVLLSLPPEWSEFRTLARGAVYLCVTSGLVRHLVDALREPA
jgi:hypothetical protein